MARAYWWLWIALAVVLWPHLATAHPSAISGMAIEIDGRTIDAELRLDATSSIDLVARTSNQTTDRSDFEGARGPILAYLDERLTLRADEQGCTRGETRALHYDAQSDRMIVQARYECPTAPQRLHIECVLFDDEDTPHRIMAGVVHGSASRRYFFGGGETTATITVANLREQLGPAAGFEGRMATPPPGAFSRTAPASTVDRAAPIDPRRPSPAADGNADTAEPAGIGQDIALGVTHILGGPDHVLFVLCLLLAATTGRRLLLVITAFTIAHSVTLVLGTLQLVIVSPRLVEPIIALSIVWVAVEGIWKPQREARPAAAFGFGLAHGLGFCGVLAGLGLTGTDLAIALVGFNVGVELGQLAVVLAGWPLWIWWQSKHPQRAARTRRVLFALIAIVATYWLFDRVLG